MMLKYKTLPHNGTLREAGRPKNSWRRSVITEAGRSRNELRFPAADKQEWKEFPYNLQSL
jgi:hypothetical protein